MAPTRPPPRRVTRTAARMPISRPWRRALLVGHISSAGAWIGIDVVVAVLVGVGHLAGDAQTRGLAYRALAAFAVWPMLASALACLGTGVLLGLGTTWGLVRYWWVAVKLAANLALGALVVFALRPGMDDVAAYGAALSTSGAADPAAVSDLVYPPVVSLTALVVAVALSVVKPWGRMGAGRGAHAASDPKTPRGAGAATAR
ncbi:MAG: hypothetical protein ACRCYR_03330 [Phycicoccus sp.]